MESGLESVISSNKEKPLAKEEWGNGGVGGQRALSTRCLLESSQNGKRDLERLLVRHLHCDHFSLLPGSFLQCPLIPDFQDPIQHHLQSGSLGLIPLLPCQFWNLSKCKYQFCPFLQVMLKSFNYSKLGYKMKTPEHSWLLDAGNPPLF